MSQFFSRNMQNLYTNKKYYGHTFLLPPDYSIEALKKAYYRFRQLNGPKTLNEFKRLALEEAKKKATYKMNYQKKEREIMKPDDVLKIISAVYDIISPLIVKVNQNFKNERRKNYQDNEKYLEIIKTFENQKINLINFTLKSICKATKVSYINLQESTFYYVEQNHQEICDKINSFSKIGKVFAIAPKKVTVEEIIEILKTYCDNLNYMVQNSNNGTNEYTKYALILLNDLIFENYGIEEEQIYVYISDKNLTENPEIKNILKMIETSVQNNFGLLYDL
jgi:hypothetical protein